MRFLTELYLYVLAGRDKPVWITINHFFNKTTLFYWKYEKYGNLSINLCNVTSTSLQITHIIFIKDCHFIKLKQKLFNNVDDKKPENITLICTTIWGLSTKQTWWMEFLLLRKGKFTYICSWLNIKFKFKFKGNTFLGNFHYI